MPAGNPRHIDLGKQPLLLVALAFGQLMIVFKRTVHGRYRPHSYSETYNSGIAPP